MSRVNKSVSFNTEDELDAKLLVQAERPNSITGKKQNFSKYVKRLIEEDIARGSKSDVNAIPFEENDPIVRKEKDAYTLEAMGGFL